MIWSRSGDGDIVVATPNNKYIFWRNRGSTVDSDWGLLNMDAINGTGPENVYWSNSGPDPPNGDYHVCFQPYDFSPLLSVGNPVSVTVTGIVSTGARVDHTKTFISGFFTSYTQCDPNSVAFVMTLTYPF